MDSLLAMIHLMAHTDSSGFGGGFGAGIAVGAGIGFSSSNKKTQRQIAAAIESQDISVLDKHGNPISADALVEFLRTNYRKA